MAKERSTTARDEARAALPPVRGSQLLASGALLAAVVIVLVLGAVLRSDPEELGPDDHARLESVEPAAAVAESRNTDPPSTLVRVADGQDALARRTTEDLRRLTALPDDWTLQLELLCEADRARILIERHGAQPAFHVLPAFHGGVECYRVCWNHYPSAEEARLAPDLPPELRTSGAFPQRIVQVTP